MERSSEDSLDSLPSHLQRCPLTPSLSPRKRTTSQTKTEPPLLRTNKRTIYTAGRPPWYNVTGTTFTEAFVIGLCGGSASGKTTVANKIIEALDVPWVVLLSMDSFYKVLNKEEQELAGKNEYNFDHPEAFDFELLVTVLRKLKKGKSIKVPVYDFTSHSRSKEWKTVYGANVVIFEGILAFANKELLKLLDMKVFVDTDSDIRLVRRLKRDITARGRDINGVIKQYNKFVKPAFEQYIEPTVQVADIVVPRGGDNFVALDLIVQHVHSQLEKREITVRSALASAHQGQPLPETLSLMEDTPQVRGMHTIIRNKETNRDEFIFYSKRLMRLLIEHALSFLPLKPVSVETPQGAVYEGKRLSGSRITGVSILRAGETMEQALMAVCKDIRLGKILIQTNHNTGEPELHYLRLPKEISEDYVILMDSTVSTGAAALMAIRVLLDHDVQEQKIFLLSLLMAEMGVHSVAYAFPGVRIITTAVDKEVNDQFHIIPGIERSSSSTGERYEAKSYTKRLQKELTTGPQMLIVGDRAVNKTKHFFSKNTKVLCFTNDMVSNISEKILEITAEHPTVKSLVIHTGALDVVKQQSEVLKRDFNDLLNKVRCLNTEVFISGPLPTVRRGDERFSRLLMLNRWLKDTCAAQSVNFIDNFKNFWERRHLFEADGFCLNKSGVISGTAISGRTLLRTGVKVTMVWTTEKKQPFSGWNTFIIPPPPLPAASCAVALTSRRPMSPSLLQPWKSTGVNTIIL
ncbi:Uridine-cytidine kinase-like 1 [Merluccius polli]|uniref:Uridine-cytidine kinase n=1 Tax=Merluccius polli TaxID=89951 RepID=A0AA47M8G3_MERPO|nr:Uridine-cytidine kinase-like 1 [Merluccius polli]